MSEKTVQPVFKDRSWEKNNEVSFHRRSFIYYMVTCAEKEYCKWEIESEVVIGKELLIKWWSLAQV